MSSDGDESGGGVVDGAEALADAFTGYVGSSVRELVKDYGYYLRWRNAHVIWDLAEGYLRKRRAKGKKVIPAGLAIRFLDQATLDDEPGLHDLWARLLANAVDPDSGYDLSKIHISLLGEMNAMDALLLEYIRGQGWLRFAQVAELTGNDPLDCRRIAEDLGKPENEIALAIGNLWRLGCLIQEPTWKSGIGPSAAKNSAFRPSPLAISLVKAVMVPEREP